MGESVNTPLWIASEGATIAANQAKTRVSIAHELARQFWVGAAVEAKALGRLEHLAFAIMRASGHRELSQILYEKGKRAKKST